MAFVIGAICALTSANVYALEPKQCLSMADMNAALKAEGQRTLFIANRTALKSAPERKSGIAADQWVNTFTSNANGSLGYNLEGDKKKGELSSLVCVRAKYINVRLYDARKPGTPPAAKRGGNFDLSLKSNEALGTRPAMQADTIATAPDGSVREGNGLTLLANMKAKGAYMVVNYEGGDSADLFMMTDAEYTPTALARLEAAARTD